MQGYPTTQPASVASSDCPDDLPDEYVSDDELEQNDFFGECSASSRKRNKQPTQTRSSQGEDLSGDSTLSRKRNKQPTQTRSSQGEDLSGDSTLSQKRKRRSTTRSYQDEALEEFKKINKNFERYIDVIEKFTNKN